MKLMTTILCLALATMTQAETLKVASDPWCPFACDSKSDRPGLFIEILKEAIGPMDSVEYEEVSWSRAVGDAKNGKFNALVGALKADAPDFVYPKNPMANQRSCFFVRQDSKWNFKNESSLKKVTVAAVSGYTYGEPVDSYFKSNVGSDKIEYLSGVDVTYRLYKKLSDQRAEVVIEDQSVMEYTLAEKKVPSSEWPRNAGCLKKIPLYIAFSPFNKAKSTSLAQKFDDGFARLQKTKRIQFLFKKYNLKAP